MAQNKTCCNDNSGFLLNIRPFVSSEKVSELLSRPQYDVHDSVFIMVWFAAPSRWRFRSLVLGEDGCDALKNMDEVSCILYPSPLHLNPGMALQFERARVHCC